MNNTEFILHHSLTKQPYEKTANGKKTNPTVYITGGDENYLNLNAYNVEYGRNLNSLDIQTGRMCACWAKMWQLNCSVPIQKA